MRLAFVLVGILAGATPTVGARADGLEPDTRCGEDVARKVQAHYEAITSWSASFEQTRRAVVFGGGVAPPEPARTGTVVLAKPGRMRWSYELPEPSLFLTDGSVVWMWDPLLEEAQRLPDAGGLLSGAAVRFLMGEGDLLESFQVKAVDCEASPVRLELVPRKDEGYERLAIDVDATTGQVAASTVTDLFGNRTTVAFRDVNPEASPDPALFTFVPPEGATVIDLGAPGGAAAPGGWVPRSGADAGR